MHIFYHVDMAGTLRTGMEMDLSPIAPSVFGSNYWEKFKRAGIKDIPSLQGACEAQDRLVNKATYREFWLEVFRKDHPEINGLGMLCKTSLFVWQASACHGILTAHEANQP